MKILINIELFRIRNKFIELSIILEDKIKKYSL
jgi:hypothetical protein